MRALVVGLLVLAPLAGCVSEAPASGVELDGADAPAVDPTTPLPDNRSGTFNAFEETNATERGSGGLEHDHDYWLGRDRVDIFSDRVRMDEFPSPGGGAAFLALPQGTLVFEGTATVEVVLSKPQRHACEFTVYTNGEPYCTDSNPAGLPTGPGVDDPSPPALVLHYRHAAVREWVEAGPVTWGTPLAIPVLPEQTDMPHSTATLWSFMVTTTDAAAATLTFEAVVTIVRGATIAEWPGHPDFYANGHSRLIFAGNATTREAGVEGLATGDRSSFGQQAPNRLISYGTRAVRVWVNVTSVDAPPGAAFGEWYLRYHNASGGWTRVDPITPPADPASPKDLLFEIPVDDAGMDSPYAPESRWEFNLRAVLTTPRDAPTWVTLIGFVAYEVAYDMTIVATDTPLPDAEAS